MCTMQFQHADFYHQVVLPCQLHNTSECPTVYNLAEAGTPPDYSLTSGTDQVSSPDTGSNIPDTFAFAMGVNPADKVGPSLS